MQPEVAHEDDLLMDLVNLALAQPSEQRKAYLRSACAEAPSLFEQAWDFVQWEERMGDFLMHPLYSLDLSDVVFQPGDLLFHGRFRIIRKVGEGGMGIVYEAWDEKLGQRVAVKCAKTGFRGRLPKEVILAREVSHKNVCRIHDLFSTPTERGEIDFISMEFLDGDTLTERLNSGPLPEKQARAIALQLCDGLAAAHHKQVIHGDLKSNNVILAKSADGSMRAVITDFGLAKDGQGILASTKASGQGVSGGAPDYMAPELWKGHKASVASDIYALGVIFYEMLSGARLHPPDSTWEQRLRRKPPSVHRKWDGVLARCLDPDPARRYASVDEVKGALEARSLRWMLAAAASVVLAVLVAYDIATAPPEKVRLVVAPIAGAGDLSAALKQIKGNKHTSFRLLLPGKAEGATHRLDGTLRPQSGQLELHAQVTDLKSGDPVKSWDAEYAPDQIKYIPGALAGIVTETFHLTPPMVNAKVNAAAKADYEKGLAAVRYDSKVDEAIADLAGAVKEDRDSPLTWAGLAEAAALRFSLSADQASRARWSDRATESERQAEIRNPDLAAVHRISGLLAGRASRYDQAVLEYRRAIELDLGGGDAYRRLGAAYEASGEIDNASAEYSQAIRVEPLYYRNYRQFGEFLFRRAQYSEAVTNLEKALSLAPGETGLLKDLGQAYMNAGRFTEAAAVVQRSLSGQESPAALKEMGYLLMYERKDREAIPYFLRAINLGGDSYGYWTYLGIAYRRSAMLGESTRANQRGLQLADDEVARNPRNYVARTSLAYLSSQLGDSHRAGSEILEALQLSPSNADTRWMAAITYEALHERENTIKVLKTAPHGVVADLSRWPDVADLNKDPRFIQLLRSH